MEQKKFMKSTPDGKAEDCPPAASDSIPASAKLKLHSLNITRIDRYNVQ